MTFMSRDISNPLPESLPDATGYSGDKHNDLDAYGDFVVAMWFSKAVQGEPHFVKNPDLRSLFIMTAGLGGETGEVLEKLKKYVRDNTFERDLVVKELGDVLYYAVRIARYFGITPSEMIASNIEKLEGRHARGTLQGSGDNR